ncbi:hypothetical protein FKM82_013065 [Ascaphus truei]
MSSLLTFTWVISALIATGYSLLCIHCASSDQSFCSGIPQPCPSSQHVCTSSYSMTTIDGVNLSKIFARLCDKSQACNKSGSIGIPQGRIKSSTTCCNSDNCTPATPTFAPESSEKNGVRCGACMSVNSKSCAPSTTLECTGNENQCILQVSTVSAGATIATAVRGCASKSICEFGSQETEMGSMKVKAEVSCTSTGIALHHNLFLVALAALSLWKLVC